MLASKKGHKEAVEILLSSGVDVNFISQVGEICDCVNE